MLFDFFRFKLAGLFCCVRLFRIVLVCLACLKFFSVVFIVLCSSSCFWVVSK